MRNPDALRARAGIRGDPRRDQHFLIDERVLNRIPEYARDLDTTSVLEIGPGTGALTDRLLAIADRVTAIEQDPDLVAFLRDEFHDAITTDCLRIIHGDATTDPLPEYSASISNLPYGSASPILFRLLPRRQPLIVMVQAEFADRMAAGPGDPAYGRLSVTAQHYARITPLEPVPPTAFDPPPPVHSTIVRTTPHTPAYTVPSDEAFHAVVTALFTQRRKTTRNAIRNTTHISGIPDPGPIIDALEPDLLDRRPEALTPAEFARITRHAHPPTTDESS